MSLPLKKEAWPVFCFVFCFFLFRPNSAEALLNVVEEHYQLNVTGFLGAGGSAAKYPGPRIVFPERSETFWYTDLRFIGDLQAGESFGAKINLLQTIQSQPATDIFSRASLLWDAERSGALYWRQHDSGNSRAAAVIDSFFLQYGNRDNELTVGRQPVSTTVTFYFTPNDFFAPFSASTFFRVYKPGVDAIRYERRLASLSQLSLIGVLSYAMEPGQESGWSDTPDWQAGSLLTRATYTAGLSEWGGICGIVRESLVTGVSFQGEVFQWLGIRAEGHYANSWGERSESGLKMAIGFEHRFASSLVVRLEQMYNGLGSSAIQEFLEEVKNRAPSVRYSGHHYSALAAGYEVSPLLQGEMLYLRNWTDGSSMLSLYVVYSVSDESEVAFTASFPGGPEPETGGIQSEMGSLPVRFMLEFRMYF